MKAIRIHEFGPTEEVLRYEDVPPPEPAADEILIKVEAAALNRADLGLRKGTYRVSPDQLPIIPGREFAGPIAKIGGPSKTSKPAIASSPTRARAATPSMPSQKLPRCSRCRMGSAPHRRPRFRRSSSPRGSACWKMENSSRGNGC